MVIQALLLITLVIGVFYLIMTSLNKGALEFVEANKSTNLNLKVDESKTKKVEVKETKVKKIKKCRATHIVDRVCLFASEKA